MQNITVKPICPYISVVVCSIIIHNIKTIPEVSMHLCKFWVKVTPFYSIVTTVETTIISQPHIYNHGRHVTGCNNSGMVVTMPIPWPRLETS